MNKQNLNHMKKLFLGLSLCLVIVSVKAQNIWKPISYNGTFLGAGPDGSIYTTNYIGDHNIMISKDDGETWQVSFPGEGCYFNPFCFTVSKEGRVFVVDNQSDRVFYTSNNGLTWQYTEPIPIESWDNAYILYAATNNIIVGRTDEQDVFYTIDGGVTWQIHHIDIIDPDYSIYDIIVNENGDVYASIYNPFRTNMGIYHSSVYNINNWELVEFEGLGIRDIAFDPEGNVVCGVVSGSFPGFVHKPGFYAFSSNNSIAISDNGVTFTWKERPAQNAVLTYSLDHGASFSEIGEELPLSMFTFEGSISKGYDNHLYFLGNGLKKSVSNADELINQTDSCWNGSVAYSFDGGEGSYENPYRISSAEQLALIAEWCNLWNPFCYILTKDICLNGSNGLIWKPIGNIIEEYTGNSFSGIFDGNGHIIYDMRVDETCGSKTAGLFGYTYQATIKNVIIESSIVENDADNSYSKASAALLVGQAEQTNIISCTVNGVVHGTCNYNLEGGFVGGIVGFSENNNIIDCFNYASVNGNVVGGIVGKSTLDTISVCGNYGDITGIITDNATTFAGGISGQGDYIGDCFNHGNITTIYDGDSISSSIYLGGIAGYVSTEGHINNVYNIGDIEESASSDYDLGIIAGHALSDDFTDCYWHGEYNIPVCGNLTIQNSCAFNYDETSGRWILDESHHGTTDFLEALNISSSSNCYWYLDGDGYPRPGYFGLNYSLIGTEWYYEITNGNGAITYQHLECAADTAINSRRAKVIVKSNTLYDKDLHAKITHEYIDYDDGVVYWWDKQSESYTTLYNFDAQIGDEWTIHVGNESITMHVDNVFYNDYEGKTYRVMTVSDANDIFSGDIICGIGHTTSFFPERLLNNRDIDVDGIRCYWSFGEQMIQFGDTDCDEIYDIIHFDVEEIQSETISVYPNPTNGIIMINIDNSVEFTITNICGQTIMRGVISGDNQQINVENLENGMYFLNINNQIVKIIKN